MSAAEEKRRLRREMSPRRSNVDPQVASAAAVSVCERLLNTAALRAAGRIALYAALADELPTHPLFVALREQGIVPLLPRVTPDARLEFAPVASWGDLATGSYGVPEPPAASGGAALHEGDLVMVPGVAFDEAGHRLGRGAGCYDRTFAGTGGPLLVGLAYEFQVLPSIPCDGRDREMDAIFTERRARWTGRDTP